MANSAFQCVEKLSSVNLCSRVCFFEFVCLCVVCFKLTSVVGSSSIPRVCCLIDFYC